MNGAKRAEVGGRVRRDTVDDDMGLASRDQVTGNL